MNPSSSRNAAGSFADHLRASVRASLGKYVMRPHYTGKVKPGKATGYDQKFKTLSTQTEKVSLPRTYGATGYTAT